MRQPALRHRVRSLYRVFPPPCDYPSSVLLAPAGRSKFPCQVFRPCLHTSDELINGGIAQGIECISLEDTSAAYAPLAAFDWWLQFKVIVLPGTIAAIAQPVTQTPELFLRFLTLPDSAGNKPTRSRFVALLFDRSCH